MTPAESRAIILRMIPGPQQLLDWRKRRGFNQAQAAEHLGFHFTYLSKLENGRQTPDIDNALKIEHQAGIPIEAWAKIVLSKSESTIQAAAGKPVETQA